MHETWSKEARCSHRGSCYEVKLVDPWSFNAGLFQLMLNITQCLARQWSHAAPGVESLRGLFSCVGGGNSAPAAISV